MSAARWLMATAAIPTLLGAAPPGETVRKTVDDLLAQPNYAWRRWTEKEADWRMPGRDTRQGREVRIVLTGRTDRDGRTLATLTHEPSSPVVPVLSGLFTDAGSVVLLDGTWWKEEDLYAKEAAALDAWRRGGKAGRPPVSAGPAATALFFCRSGRVTPTVHLRTLIDGTENYRALSNGIHADLTEACAKTMLTFAIEENFEYPRLPAPQIELAVGTARFEIEHGRLVRFEVKLEGRANWESSPFRRSGVVYRNHSSVTEFPDAGHSEFFPPPEALAKLEAGK